MAEIEWFCVLLKFRDQQRAERFYSKLTGIEVSGVTPAAPDAGL